MQAVDINKKADNDLVDVDADEERSSRRGRQDVEGEDGEGKYIDEDANNYQHRHLDIKHDVDDKYRDELRVHGLTEEEWKLKQKKEAANLEELNQKEKELLEAQVEVTKAQHSLTDEKKKIDKEIKEKLEQNEKLKLEFEKRAAERQEAERRAAEERERAELAERQEEKNRRAQQLKQTEEIEQNAYELHEKEQELKKQKAKVKDAVEEVSYEIGKVSKDIEYTKKERSLAEKRRNEVQMKKAKLESELARRKAKEDEELRHLKLLKEERRRHELKNSCKPSKVRTYACGEDGFRVIKYFDYKYDFDEDKCLEKVKRRTVKCSHYEHEDAEVEKPKKRKHKRSSKSDDDEKSEVDDEELPKVDKSPKGRKQADQFTQKKNTSAENLAQHQEPLDEDDDATQAKIDQEDQPQEIVQTNSQAKEKDQSNVIQKLSKHIGQIEGKVSEITQKYEELKKKTKTPAKQAIVQGKGAIKSKDKVEKYAQMLK